MLTVSGGATSLIGDLGDGAGINFPPIGEATNRRLQQILGVERHFANPVDTVGMPRLRKDGNIAAVLDALLADDGVDVIGLVLGMRSEGAGSHQELIDHMSKVAKVASKPLMVLSFMSNSLTALWRGYGKKHGLPLIEDLERGLKAVRHLIDYAAFRRRIAAGTGKATPRPADLAARALLASLEGARTLTEAESKKVLAVAGLPVTREALAKTPEEAVRLAGEIGGPVALKVQSPDIPHKSDVGGVRLGMRTSAEVETAARKVLENSRRACADARIDGVLVQEMVEDGVEFILGMTYDAQFGPLVVLGAGGVLVEVFKDAAVRLPPLTADDVRDMIKGLKSAKLLDGFRGRSPRDVDALVNCCVRFSEFVAATDGHIAAIDLNPVMVCGKGKGVRIADAVIVTRTHEEDTAP